MTANTNTQPEALRLADECEHSAELWLSEVRTRTEAAAELRRLHAECEKLRKSLALVKQHHATAWNRGHTMGMAANRQIAREAQEAVARDAWGNTQLTEALLKAEAEGEALRADAERWRNVRSLFHITEHIGVSLGCPATKVSTHWHGWVSGTHEDATSAIDARIRDAALAARAAIKEQE